jgi:hypothetical protein
MSLQKMKRVMPSEHLKQVERNLTSSQTAAASQQQMVILKRPPRPLHKRPRKHNDSISESKLIKEKLPSSSLATIGKSTNVLISRNNHNILDNIDLTLTDGAVLKQLMNNNNGDLSLNGDGFGEENEEGTDGLGDDSDSETVTGDEESLFGPEDTDSSESEDYIISETGRKQQAFKKRTPLVTNAAARMVNP